ncbi:MAG: ABC transporter ATP-binding protein [Bacilli bacterium]|nr:ABC transporter ATP-binding protein [Bacilli bacterium]
MIQIIGLNKSFGDRKVLDEINIDIKDKEFVSIVGESGCGKSTLLNVIGQIDNNYSGQVIINNIDTGKLKKKDKEKIIRNHINYLFQNYALIDDISVYDNLLVSLEYTKLSKSEKKQKIVNVLKSLKLDELLNNKIFTLSGGEQQRVALARVILKPGGIILADEPTGNLDEKNSQTVMEALKKMNTDGKTIIMVTHSEELAKQTNRIIKLKEANQK